MKVKSLLVQASRAIAAVIVAVISGMEFTPPWWLLTALGVFIFASEFISARIDRSRSRTMQRIQQRALRVIAHLASATSTPHDLLVVDVYLPEIGWTKSRRVKKRLVRALSLTLTDVQPVPPDIELSDSNPLAECYSKAQELIWCDRELNHNLKSHRNYPREICDELKRTYGAVSVNPIVNNTGHDCQGILVIHTKRDPELVTAAFGVIDSSLGRRHISESCHDIHDYLTA